MIKKFDDLIYIKENALDKEFCEHCVKKFKEDDRKEQGITGGGLRLDIKRSLDLNISSASGWKGEDKIFYNSLNEALHEYIDQHKEYMPILQNTFDDSGYQLQETKPGEFYNWHSDYGVEVNGTSRILTYLWYLNDVTYEGETEFFTGKKIKPETGKIIIFPATWMYFHQGRSPKKEIKYICTGWLYQDVQFT